jgi:hypothetical protein
LGDEFGVLPDSLDGFFIGLDDLDGEFLAGALAQDLTRVSVGRDRVLFDIVLESFSRGDNLDGSFKGDIEVGLLASKAMRTIGSPWNRGCNLSGIVDDPHSLASSVGEEQDLFE